MFQDLSNVKDSGIAKVIAELAEGNSSRETRCIESEAVVSLEMVENDENVRSEEFESISHVTNHSNVEDQNT